MTDTQSTWHKSDRTKEEKQMSVMAENVNISVINRKKKQNIRWKRNRTLGHHELRPDIEDLRTQLTAECRSFSRVHATFSRVDHLLGHKRATTLKIFKSRKDYSPTTTELH